MQTEKFCNFLGFLFQSLESNVIMKQIICRFAIILHVYTFIG